MISAFVDLEILTGDVPGIPRLRAKDIARYVGDTVEEADFSGASEQELPGPEEVQEEGWGRPEHDSILRFGCE